jgi:hypothetical protein
MHGEVFAAEQHQIDVMEPWLDEPSEKAGLALARSGLESVCKTSRLERLPNSPFRSVGGYLNYAGWPDCERFIELDRAIQRHARENQNTEGGADSNDCPAESYPENLADIYSTPERSRLATDCQEHWTGLSFADLIIGFEDLPIRRL